MAEVMDFSGQATAPDFSGQAEALDFSQHAEERPDFSSRAASPREQQDPARPVPTFESPIELPDAKPGERSIYEEPTWLDQPTARLGDFLIKAPGEGKTPTEEGINAALRPAINALTSPRNLAYMAATAGIGATGQAAKTALSALWAGVMGKQAIENAPEIYGELGLEMGKPEGERDKKRIAQLLTQSGIDATLAVLPAAHLGTELRGMRQSVRASERQSVGVSEFGGERDLPPPTTQPAPENAVPGAIVQQESAAPSFAKPMEGGTTPERAETVAAQLQWLAQGKRAAVLVTPGEAMQEAPPNMERHTTSAGDFIYNPQKVKPEALDAAVKNDALGEVLGYGIARKPAPEAEIGVVTVRGADGLEKQAVVTDAANLQRVVQAARAVAEPGDRVGFETAEEVVKGRQSVGASERQSVPTSATATPPAPAAQAPKQGASRKELPAGASEEQLGERVPDILDWIDDAYPKGVKFEGKDYVDYLQQYEERLKGLKPKQRQAILSRQRKKFLSGKEGEAANEVLDAMHRDGLYRRIESESDLAEAMSRAMESRLAAQERGATMALREGEPVSTERLDAAAQAVHGQSYADLETWQQDAIRQAVERGGVPRRVPAGEAGGRQPGSLREPMRYGGEAPGAAGPLRPARATTKAQSIQVSKLKPGDRVMLDGRDLEVVSWQGDALLKNRGQLHLQVPGEPQLWRKFNLLNGERLTRWGRSEGTAPSAAEPTKGIVSGSAAERWADQTIQEGSKRLTMGVDPELLTAYAIKGVAIIERGIRDFAAWSVEMVRHFGGEVAPHLRELFERSQAMAKASQSEDVGQGERQTGEKIAASEAISDPTKQAITEYLYQRRSNETDQEAAEGLVRSVGPDAAIQIFLQPPENLPGAVQSKLLGSITRSLAAAERTARQTGDTAGAEHLAKKQAGLWDAALPRITELAQSLQALTDLVDMSPDALVAYTKRQLDRASNEVIDGKRDEVTAVQTAIEQGRETGIEQVRQDPQVNAAAQKAVDETVANSDQVKQAIVMELAQPWSESSVILNHARAQVRSKANELLNTSPRPPGLTPREHLRQILEDLATRAASIFAGHIQGAEPGKLIVDKYMERLGLTREKATQLATAMSKEWDATVKAAQAKLPGQIRAQRLERQSVRASERAVTTESTASAIEQAIRKQLRDLNLKLGDVLQQEAGRQEGTRQHVAERIVQTSGLKGEAADTLRNVLQQRWDALVTAAQRAKLKQLEAGLGQKVGRPMRQVFEQVTTLDRVGALTGDSFLDLVKRKLGLKQLTPADAKTLRGLAQKAQDQPEGFLRQQAAARVLAFTEKLKGTVNWRDIPMGIFYANVLSGVTTPAKILFENTNLLVGQTVANLISRPGQLLHPVEYLKDLTRAYGRGAVKGALQAGSTLKTGIVSGVWERPRVYGIMEMQPFGRRMDALNVWKWIGRGIGMAHEATFKPAWEVKQTAIARDLARKEGLRGPALDQRVADLLANTPAAIRLARSQALAELANAGNTSRLELARRAREILEQRREENMPGSSKVARDFALRTVYLNEPYGFMGVLAKAVRDSLEKGRREAPVVGTVVKAQLPFTTVISNILNEKLNWSPVGLYRAARSHFTGELYGQKIVDPTARGELYAKAMLGTIATGVLAEVFGQHIHGNGPSDPRHRKQWLAAGAIPTSIELGGRYYSMANTPLALPVAAIGNWMDWQRYGKGSAADGATRVAFALKAAVDAVMSQGFFEQAKKVLEALGNPHTAEGAGQLQKALARTASSFVVPNLVQQIDRLYDPTVYDQTGIEALVKSQVPFVRRGNQPALTVLGDEVQSGPFHYWASKVTEDPLLRVLAEKQAWVPEPDRNVIVGSPKRGPEYARALTAEEYYDFIRDSGREIRRRLTESLDVLATSEPAEAQKLVRKIANEEHARAKMLFQ